MNFHIKYPQMKDKYSLRMLTLKASKQKCLGLYLKGWRIWGKSQQTGKRSYGRQKKKNVWSLPHFEDVHILILKKWSAAFLRGKHICMWNYIYIKLMWQDKIILNYPRESSGITVLGKNRKKSTSRRVRGNTFWTKSQRNAKSLALMIENEGHLLKIMSGT